MIISGAIAIDTDRHTICIANGVVQPGIFIVGEGTDILNVCVSSSAIILQKFDLNFGVSAGACG